MFLNEAPDDFVGNISHANAAAEPPVCEVRHSLAKSCMANGIDYYRNLGALFISLPNANPVEHDRTIHDKQLH